MLGTLRRAAIRGTLAAGLVLGTVAPGLSETLAQAMADAYRHNGLMEQNRAVLRAADEDVALAVAALRPVLNWSGDVTRRFGQQRSATSSITVPVASTTATIGLLAELTLFDGGVNRLELESAKEVVLATRARLVAVEQQVLLRAAEAFMEVRRAQENVALRNNNVRVLRQEVRAAKDRFEVGEVTRTDVALAEARLSAAQSNLASAEGALVRSIEEFRNVVGRKPGNLQTPTSLPKLPGSVDRAKALAVRNHPEMTQAQHNVTASELGIQLAEAALNPTVTLRGSVDMTQNFGNQGFSQGGTVGVRAQGPIYQGGRLSALIRKAMARRDEARGNLHVVRHNVQQNVGNAYVLLRVARSSKEAFRDQVRAATVAFRGVREEATLGARTTLDVLDAEQELLDARANLISAEVDEMIAAYTVLATIGQLTADSLKLNVPLYDPAEYYNLVKDAPLRSRQGEQLDRVLKALGKN